MNIFELILSPFIFIIKQLFLFGYHLTGNYGWAIILLSFFISLLLLPVFIYIEKAKKKTDAVKRKMQPLVDEIKRCYKGQERYYYLKTLNRQHGYSPLKAMIPILSLLLQIPFFIAAYQYLEHFEALQGVTFGFIKDLSQPDSVFGAINILPIAMTVVNLITAWFYTRNGNTSERKQMLVVALAFLILLYKLPAGLVLYWTMNNIFSFFRLFVTNPEVFKKDIHNLHTDNKLKISFDFSRWLYDFDRIFPVVVIVAILSQLNWACHNSFNSLVIRLAVSIVGSIVVSGFILLVISASKNYIKNILSEKILNKANNFFENIKSEYIFSITGLGIFFKYLFWALATLFILLQLNWIIKHSYEDIVIRLTGSIVIGWILTLVSGNIYFKIKNNNQTLIEWLKYLSVKPKYYFSLLFLVIYFHLASLYYYSGFNETLSLTALILLVPLQFIAVIYFLRYFFKEKNFTAIVIAIIHDILFIIQMLYVAAVIKGSGFDFSIVHINFAIVGTQISNIILPGIFIILITLPFYLKSEKVKIPVLTKWHWSLYVLSVLYLSGFVFLWNPLAIYSSFPANFVFPAIEILKHNIGLFSISLFSLLAVYLLIPKKYKSIWLLFILTVTILAFIHNTIFPIKMGSLQETRFLNPDNLKQPLLMYIFEGIGIIAILSFVIFLLKRNLHKQFAVSLLVLNLILIIQSLTVAINTKTFYKKEHISEGLSSSISFSRDKQNVIMFVSDMFHGWYMKKILEENPELKKEFKGFVWYPNTLSVSSITLSSIAPILGGYDYTIDKLNKDDTVTFQKKITNITELFYSKVKSEGFDFTATDMIYSKIDKNKFDYYLPKWSLDWNIWNSTLHIGVSKEVGYTLLAENAAFYSAPLFLKSKIYNKGKWLHKNEKTNENTNSAKRLNRMRLLPYISNTKNENPNFIYIHSYASHHPWCTIDQNGVMHEDVDIYKNNEWVIKTFAKWIDWMKQNGVYDNTKIVLLSDHGPHWQHFKGDIDYNIPVIKDENLNLNIDFSWVMGMYPLLMVKDYNTKGNLKESWKFMSNADASYIALDEKNPLMTTDTLNRVLPSMFVFWKRKIWLNKTLNIRYKVKAHNSAFDTRKWEKVK